MTQRLILVAAIAVVCAPSLANAQCEGIYGGAAPTYYAPGGYPAAYRAPQIQRPVYSQAAYATPAYATPAYYPVMNQVSSRRYAAYPVQSQAYRPIYPLASPQASYVGQGILGQPKAYVSGQPVRNFLRYITP